MEFPNKGVPLQKSQVQRTLREGLGTMVFPLSDCWVAWNQPFRKKIEIRAARCGVRHAAKCGVNFFLGERVLVVNLEESTIRLLQGGQLLGWTLLENVLKGANGNCTFGWLFS